MSSEYINSVTSSHPVWLPSVSFSFLIAVSGNSNSELNRSGESWHPCLVPVFSGNVSCFSLLSYYIDCGFVINGFYYVEICSICTHFGIRMVGVEFCQMAFLHLLRRSCRFWLFFLIWYITLICVYWTILVSLGWIPLGCGIWSVLCVVRFNWLILCWEFLHLYSSNILACSFLFSWYLCLVLVSGWWWLHRMSLRTFPPLQSFGRVWEGLV